MLVDDATNLRLRCHPLEVDLNWGLHGFTPTLIFRQKFEQAREGRIDLHQAVAFPQGKTL